MKIASLMLALLLASGCHRSTASESSDETARPLSAKPSSDTCKACQAKHCSAVLAACTSQECSKVRACVRDTKCGDTKRDTLVPCYCGATEQDDCFFAKAPANGPCKAVIEAGAKSTSALEIGQRFFDMTFPTGQAVQLATCEQTFCKECL